MRREGCPPPVSADHCCTGMDALALALALAAAGQEAAGRVKGTRGACSCVARRVAPSAVGEDGSRRRWKGLRCAVAWSSPRKLWAASYYCSIFFLGGGGGGERDQVRRSSPRPSILPSTKHKRNTPKS